MFLGALLPMLCTFYSKALESIDLMTGNQKVQIEGLEVEIGLEDWKEMARTAMKKEADRVDTLVDEMEKLSLKHGMVGGALCNAAGALWDPLCYKLSNLVRNTKGVGRVFADNIGR